MRESKHAQRAQAPTRWPQPGSIPAAAAGDVSKADKATGNTGGSVTSSRLRGTTAGSLPEASGMSWNPVRLSSPFEKAAEKTAEPPTGVCLSTSHPVVEHVVVMHATSVKTV